MRAEELARAEAATESSHLRCMTPSALAAFTLSIPTRLSISTE